mmetsp:Transcript_33214/g.56465  ORF Transcript_33214/g.56465 Transcript_33214/m.56465 type:complete len:146 (+) Transcript_33214:690-1127(+)|eukprot:CAMPEP_0183748380 /NCGR_PEP_ID=MMETSP0737-20130205/67739_1 /TAXON_ID=385413 /ORGANISM="Thalassiosira miniscula, Strain CCMP1093" /LENGTH=145 /DNA_ID=CAMNT_0025984103 /DNA_START=684 /DNA_END=1121 /DNA_ORIENTATION=-
MTTSPSVKYFSMSPRALRIFLKSGFSTLNLTFTTEPSFKKATHKAINALGTEHDKLDNDAIFKLLHSCKFHGSNTVLQELVKSKSHLSPIEQYCFLQYGPTHHIQFNKFGGQCLVGNEASSLSYEHDATLSANQLFSAMLIALQL